MVDAFGETLADMSSTCPFDPSVCDATTTLQKYNQ